MIRPIDLQTAIISTQQTAPAVQRAESGVRTDAQVTQAAFAAELTHRDESVAPTSEAHGNRVGAKSGGNEKRESGTHPDGSRLLFDEIDDDSAEVAEEPPHIVDYTA